MRVHDPVMKQFQNDGLENEFRGNQYYKSISQLQAYIHSQIPYEDFDTTAAATSTEIREELFEGVNYKRAVIFLMTNGCEWALKGAHGCTMCGHLGKQAIRTAPISAVNFIKQFHQEFKKNNFKTTPLLNLFNNGSFFNDREIPRSARIEILKMIGANPDIKMLVIETRPEFVTEEKIKEIKPLLAGMQVEIAMGLELKNDYYRTLCLNKGFSLKTYNRAADIITKHFHLRTYVFLKPPFLTEMESIEQAIETVDYAFTAGSTTVSLESCTVQDYTLIKALYDENLYVPPWLWSIIEVAERNRVPKKLIIGLFQFFPSPTTVPHNCPRCSELIMKAIVKYNRTLDKRVFKGLGCECKKEWEKKLEEKPLPFEERVEQIIGQLKNKIEVL